jgi:Acetyltransferase (GNAT) domain
MECEFVNPLLEPQWNSWILEQGGATFFHTAEWAQVLIEAYNYRPQYAVFKEAGRILGILPIMEVRSPWTGRRGVCLPFSDECGPLLSGGLALSEVMGCVKEQGLRSEWSYLELRGGANTLPAAIQSDAYLGHRLPLEASEELQFARLRGSHRRSIQKSLREGVEVEHLQSREAMDVFYALHCRTRRHHGVPPQPIRFFHLIHKIVIEPGHGFVSLARFQGRSIAGAVYFHFGSHAIYKFGASDRRFQHLRPNNLVMWKAVCQFQREHCAELSLGRTDLQDDGLLQFKRGWGGTESRLEYHRIGLKREVRRIEPTAGSGAGLARRVARLMPLAVLRLVGSLAYRHIG